MMIGFIVIAWAYNAINENDAGDIRKKEKKVNIEKVILDTNVSETWSDIYDITSTLLKKGVGRVEFRYANKYFNIHSQKELDDSWEVANNAFIVYQEEHGGGYYK